MMQAFRPLMSHQEPAVSYLLQNDNSFLAMEMRLGKTLAVIRAIRLRCPDSSSSRFLIVAPLTVLHAWEEELDREGEAYSNLAGLSMPKRLALLDKMTETTGRHYVLCNYETVRSFPLLMTYVWDTVVADESTRIKNPRAQITQIMIDQTRCVPHRIALTGSPAPEGDMDLFTQMVFVFGSFMGYRKFWEWRSRCFDKYAFAWVPRKGIAERIRQSFQTAAFCMTRSEAGLYTEKVYETRMLRLPADVQALYDEAEETFAVGDNETNWILVLQTWLARLAGGFTPDGELVHGVKCDELLTLLQNELSGEQAVVWFRFNSEIDYVRERLENKGITCAVVYGAASIEQRKQALRDVRSGRARILLCQVLCAKYGLDVSCLDTAIYYSNSYSCEARQQSEDRIIHPSKKRPGLYIDLIARGTVDEDVLKALHAKTRNSREFLEVLQACFMERRGNGTVRRIGQQMHRQQTSFLDRAAARK